MALSRFVREADYQRNVAPYEQAEAERLGQLEMAQALIDQIFDSPERQRQISDYGRALQEGYLTQLLRGREDTERQSRQSLARRGLIGGSAHADASRRLGDVFAEGVTAAELQTQQAMEAMRGADEQQRFDLHNFALTADPTVAMQRAGQHQLGQVHAARGPETVGALGDIFAGLAGVHTRGQQAQQRQRAESDFRRSLYGGGMF